MVKFVNKKRKIFERSSVVQGEKERGKCVRYWVWFETVGLEEKVLSER
jgi:hypothetical protein